MLHIIDKLFLSCFINVWVYMYTIFWYIHSKKNIRYGLVARIHRSHLMIVPMWPGFDSRCRKMFRLLENVIDF
jgi:hypothetical protein